MVAKKKPQPKMPMHKMPDGHMMTAKQMKSMMAKKGGKRRG